MHITGVLSNRIGFFGIMTYSMINLLAYLAVPVKLMAMEHNCINQVFRLSTQDAT